MSSRLSVEARVYRIGLLALSVFGTIMVGLHCYHNELRPLYAFEGEDHRFEFLFGGAVWTAVMAFPLVEACTLRVFRKIAPRAFEAKLSPRS